MKKTFGLFIIIFCAYLTSAQIITTVAGGATGHGGYWGEGGLATAAQLNIFGGIAVDKFGNIYIAQSSRIVKVDVATGLIHTVAGTGISGFNGDGILATTAQINGGDIVVVDTIGNFYIGDGNNFRIRKVDVATGIITTFAGNGINGFTGDGGPATAADFDFGAFTFDIFGNMIVQAVPDHRIRKIDPSGIITTIAGTGLTGNTGDGGPAISATMTPDAGGICTDKYGNIYFSDSFAAVRKINVSTGIITKVAGAGDFMATPYLGEGGPATDAHINPFAVAVDDSGNLYIDDDGNSLIEKVDAFGIIHSIAGTGIHGYSGDGGPATSAKINYPENVVLDGCGNVYIADFNNARVRKISYPPTPISLSNSISTPVPTACTGTPATFTAAAAASAGTIAYQWYVNGSAVPGATSGSYTYTPADADSIRCLATATSPCTSVLTSSNTIIMSVIPVTTPTITIAAPAIAPVGSMVTVSATVSGAGTGYGLHWYNNAVLFSTTSVPTTTYTKPPGTDHITATVVPGEGCYDSTISAEWLVTTGTTSVNTSVSPGEGRGEAIYPNPTHDVLYVDHLTGTGEVLITNILGQVLLSKQYSSGYIQINTSSLPCGVYIVKVTGSEGGNTITKILKQ